MAKIYQIMVGSKQINDVYYDEHDAKVNAEFIAEDTGKIVTIWEAEEIEDVPFDLLEWSGPVHVRFGPKWLRIWGSI